MDALNTNQWYHAAMTWNGDSLKLFMNGVLRSKKALSGTLRFQATEPMAVGANSFAGSPFHGSIDEVRLSNVARESWEFHVTRSRLEASRSVVHFGNVLANRSRTVSVVLTNAGTQPLLISGISSNNAHVAVEPSSAFTLFSGRSDTLAVTFSPVGEEVLAQGSQVTVTSNDPTYPAFNLPLRGAGVTTLPAGPYRTDAFTLGLWHLDETSGAAAADSSGRGMDASLAGGVSHELETVKFPPGAALRFDGLDGAGRANPPPSARVAPEWGGLTAEAWFYLRGLPLGRGTLVRRGGPSLQFHLYVDSTASVVGQAANAAQQAFSVSSKSMGALKVRQWYHAALVAEADSLRLYVNGNAVDVKPLPGGLAGTAPSAALDTLSLWIGSNAERTTPFYGILDEIRLSSTARQPWEFNVNLARFELSETRLSFENVLLGRSRTLELEVRNAGIDALVVTDVLSSMPSAFRADTTRFTVPSGGVQRVRVTFAPTVSGRANAQFTFRTNDPFWTTRNLPVDGTGLSARRFEAYEEDAFTLALFHFDEAADTSRTVLDASSAGLTGRFDGAVTRTDSGRFGRDLRFSGGSVRARAGAALETSGGPFSYEVWFSLRRRPAANAVLFSVGNGDTTAVTVWLSGADNGGLTARCWNPQGVSTTLSAGNLSSLKTGLRTPPSPSTAIRSGSGITARPSAGPPSAASCAPPGRPRCGSAPERPRNRPSTAGWTNSGRRRSHGPTGSST
jgi:hypothetical protein